MAEKHKESGGKSQVDVIEATIGSFGRWQAKISILMPLLKIPIIWFELGIVFLAPPIHFWCGQPQKYANVSVDVWRNLVDLPETNHSGEVGSCYMRDIDSPDSQEAVPCKWGYDYDRSVVHSSIITEWDLVCQRQDLVELAQMVPMLGVLVGSVLFGVAADKFGRRPILTISIILQTLLTLLVATAPWYSLFLVLRFFLGIADGGTVITSFVICMEAVGGPWRTVITVLYQIPGGIANGLMATIAFYVRDWRQLQYVIAGLGSIFLIYTCLIPESPRWLIAMERHSEAIDILESAAKTNGISREEFDNRIRQIKLNKSANFQRPGFGALTKTSELKKRTSLLCVIWFLSGTIFYAFIQYIGQIGENIYFSVFIGGVATIPGTLLCLIVVRKFGRRITIALTCILDALAFLLILAVPKGYFYADWPRNVLTFCGVVGICIAVPALYLFTSELFPTIVRNTGVGTVVMCSRLGAMVAPLVIALGNSAGHLPLTVIALISIAEGVLICLLPETFNKHIPDTINDLEDLNKNNFGSHNHHYYGTLASQNGQEERTPLLERC